MHKVNLHGFTMLLHGDNYLEEKIVKTRCWEPETTQVFRELVKPGMTIVDVGANIGYFTLLSASLAGPTGQVHAFEPYPGYQERLKQNLAVNDLANVQLVPFALSDKVEKHELYKGLASARMHKWTHTDPVFNQIHDVVVVRCLPLDEYANRYLNRIDVVKIDVDGYEMNVLRGGRESLKKYKPVVIIELFEEALVDAGSSVRQLLDFFEELDYVPYSEQGRRLDYDAVYLEATRDIKLSINVVFRPMIEQHVKVQSEQSGINKLSAGLIIDLPFHEANKWTSATTWHLVEAIRSNFDCVPIQSQSDYELAVEQLDLIISMEPHWGGHKLDLTRTKGLREKIEKIPSYIFYSDPHANKWRQDYFLNNAFDYILSFYYYPMRYHFRKIASDKIIHFPWAIPDEWIGTEPIQYRQGKYLHCFGGQKSQAYVLRNWCRNFDFVESSTNSGCENKVMTEAEYIRWLGGKDACVAAGSDDATYRLTVPKYYEIAAAGSLLFAQETDDLALLGFTHGQNCLVFNRTNFESLARKYLKNTQQYHHIRQQGRELIRQRHSLSVRMADLLGHVNQAVQQKKTTRNQIEHSGDCLSAPVAKSAENKPKALNQIQSVEIDKLSDKNKILLIVDKPGWAHDFKADNLIRCLGNDYEIIKRYCDDVKDSEIEAADIVVIFYWIQINYENMQKRLPTLQRNKHKILMGICSHIELQGQSEKPGLLALHTLASGIFVNSKLLYKQYIDVFDVPVFYTPNGVDTEFFRPSSEKKENGKLIVGWTGSLRNHGDKRGVNEFIIPAVERIDGVELKIAAREDKWRSKEEMRQFYQQIDVYICASRTEGTPNPCLEAAACGVPILTTPVGNMPELIQSGVNGYFIERDINAIASKLNLLKERKDLLKQLRKGIQETIRSWSWKNKAENYRMMFESILASSAGGDNLFRSHGQVYMASADRMDHVLENIDSLKKIPSRKIDHYISVVGGLSGLNYLLSVDPNEITFFDLNSYALEYARVIFKLISISTDHRDFISRVMGRSVELFLQRSGNTELTTENQQRYLSVPVDQSIVSDTMARLSEKERLDYQSYIVPHQAEGILDGVRNCRCLLPCFGIHERVPVGGGEDMGYDEQKQLVPNTNTFFYGHGWLESKETFLRIQTILRKCQIHYVPFNLLKGDLDVLSDFTGRVVIHASNIDDWFKDVWGKWLDRVHQRFVQRQGELYVITTNGGVVKSNVDAHAKAYLAIAPYVYGAVVEVTHKTPWGFHEFDRENVLFSDYLNSSHPADTTILHILVGEGLSIEQFKAVYGRALQQSRRVLVMEHNRNSADFSADKTKGLLSIEQTQSILTSVAEPCQASLMSVHKIAGETDLARNVLFVVECSESDLAKEPNLSDRQNQNGDAEAIRCFTAAVEKLQKGDFVQADGLMQQYRSKIDYSKLFTERVSLIKSDVDVSVIVVTYNRRQELVECLESLSKQNCNGYEVIVVDNGENFLKDYRQYIDMYVKCPVNLSLSEGRNIGACFAKGRILALLDDDALVGENYISSIKAAFDSYDIYGLRGQAMPKNNPEANKDATGYNRGDRPFATYCDLEGGSAFRKDIFLNMGGMDPLLLGYEGMDLTYRIIQQYNVMNKIIYWPDTVIYHDATTGQDEDIKRKRHELMNRYVKFKHNFDLHQLQSSIELSPLPVKQSAATFDTDSTPVILIAYNRPKHTLEVLRALKQHNVKNIYVFCDGLKTAADKDNISLVRRLVHSIDWTTPKIIERSENLGLAKSITTAVDHVFEKYDRLILLEDDCVPQQYFFEFMQTCLDKYEQNSKVFGISGYSVAVPENLLKDYPHDLYFSPRIGSWGWATWKQKWQHNNRDLNQLISLCNQNNIDLTQGGYDIPVAVHNFLTGKLKDVWTLNWVLSVYLNNGCYIYPRSSHVSNIGMDGSGLHCGATKKFDSCTCKIKPARYPDDVAYDPKILANFKSYYQANPQHVSRAIADLNSIGSESGLKVAQVSCTDNRGGAAKVSWMLKQNLSTRQISSPMFVKDKFSSESDVHVITNPAIDSGQFHAQRGLLYYDIRSTSALASNPEFTSADIFHFHNLHGGYFNPFVLPELTKLKPSVWTLHDMQAITGHCAYAFDCDKWQRGCGSCPDLRTYPEIPADQTARMWEDKRKIYEQSQFDVVVPSKWLKSIVEKSILKDKPTHLIYNGIDENVFKPIDNALVRQKLNIPVNATILGFVSDKGLADARKGASFAIEAYNYLAAKYPDLYFLSIGGQSPNAPTDRFIQIPHIEDEKVLAHIYSAADLFILPTLADNCPLVVLELMGCGIPVVSFDTGGVPELIDDGQTGLIAPRKDANTLIKLTEKLITDPNTRHRFSLAARQKLLKKFTITQMTNQYVKLYHDLIDDHRSRSKAEPKQKYLVSGIVPTYNSKSSVLPMPSSPELSDEQVDHSCLALNTSTNSPNLSWDIVRKRKKIRLYLGGIPNISEYKDLVGLDLRDSSPSCIRHDILNPIPLPDNSVYSIQSEDVFEHISYNKLISVLNELYRVLRPDGLFRLSVPDYRCDVLRDRSIKDAMGNIIFDSFGGRNADGTPGHQWFPIFESIDYAIRNSFFVNSEIEYLHYYKEDGTPVMKYIDYSKGMVTRTPDFDDRVKNPKRPMSLVVDIYKNCFTGQLEYLSEKDKWSLKSDVKKHQTTESDYLVSAIVSTYNSESFIQGCLEDLVNQTLYKKGKLEIIVVNSGSQQNEEQIVKRFQENYSNIVYIKTEKREGIYTAWNRAIKVAKGQFITNANTDDRHRQDALEVMANELLVNPDVALVYGDQIVTKTANDTFENHHGVDFTPRSDYSHERMVFGCCVGSQPMWRAKLHEELGDFDETLTCASDWDFWLRISEKYNIKRMPEFLGLYYHNEHGIEHGKKIHSFYERYIVGKRFGNPYISIIPPYQHNENPLVSVIMPAYNAADYIEEAIESVLIQNYQNFELMIINDGSTDDTEQIVKKFDDHRIRYINQENTGASSARNNGIKRSNGKFIVILDHDDMMTPDFIAQHLKAFEENHQADLIYCDDRLIDSKGNPIRVITRPEYADRKHLIRDLFRCGFPVVPFWTCIKRDVFNKIGFYNEKLIIGEDYDMIRRFVKHGLVACHLKGDYHLRRIVINSLSRNHTPEKAKSHFDVVKSFTESFDYEQLFPDVQWENIAAENRQMHARFLFALTFMTIGQDYVKTNSPVMAKAGFDYAQQQIDMCLEISPDNTKALQLMQKCKQIRSQFAEALI